MEASDITPTEGAPTPPETPVKTPTDTPVAEESVATTTDAPATGGTDIGSQLEQLLKAQHEQRAEMAALRKELDRERTARPTGLAPAALDPEQARQARLKELTDADYYCPGCGRTSSYPRECQGSAEAPHPPIEAISTDEFKNAPDPNTDPSGYADWQKGHTPAPVASA